MSPRSVHLTDRDHEILAFAAEHRLVLERQVERLVGVGEGRVRRRLDALVDTGAMRSDRVFGDLHYQIRGRGLAAIGSSLPPPSYKLASYKHDVGLGWLWLSARDGMFGPLREILSERGMRSHDGTLDRSAEPYGVRKGGYDRYGNERLHYPDLLLLDPHGRRLALELELSSKGRERTELIIGGYGADSRIDRVLYLVEAQPAGYRIRRSLEHTVREVGLSDRIRFQLIETFSVSGAQRSGPRDRSSRRQRAAPTREAVEVGR